MGREPVTTHLGLFVAIPAVMMFNYFTPKMNPRR
jgi:biopolymer transport protein ExbB/TolQ